MNTKLYLYDPRYNLKTETNYNKLVGIFGMTKSNLMTYKSKERKVRKLYYLITNETPSKKIREYYASVTYDDEVWKEVEGSGGQYLVSNHARFKRIYKSSPEGKFILPYFIKKRNCHKHRQFVKVKFKGKYKEYSVSRLVAYHFVDIYYTCDSVNRKNKADKYRYYKYEDLTVYHKNGVIYDNWAVNLEWMDRTDLAKKVAYKSKSKGTIVAKDATTGKVIDYFRSARNVAKHLYVSKQAVLDSLNHKWKTNIVAGTYIFEYEKEY